MNHNARLRKGLILANNVENDDFEVKLRLIILRTNCIKPSFLFHWYFHSGNCDETLNEKWYCVPGQRACRRSNLGLAGTLP